MSRQSLSVTGMSCASCAASIEKAVNKLGEVSQASVNFASEKLNFELQGDQKIDDVTDLINKTLSPMGYGVVSSDSGAQEDQSQITLAQKLELYYSFIASVIVFFIAMTPWGMSLSPTLSGALQLVLISPIFFYVGRHFLKSLWHFFRTGSSTMNTLIGFGTLTAYVYSSLVYFLGKDTSTEMGLQYVLYFESIGFIISFVILGKFLEDKFKRRARSGLEALFKQGAKHALVKRGDDFVDVPADQVVVGDILRIKPGSKVAVDGLVLEGRSSLDESMLTGESVPAVKEKGSSVFAGTINGEGVLKISATKVGSDTYLSELVKYVENAQAGKPKIQKLADQISNVFVPVVLALSVLVFILWMVLPDNPSWGVAVAHMAAVLVIACPCALGLATPTAVVVALSGALSRGLLVRSAQVLEEGAQINILMVDKTGTLTYGKPQVIDLTIKEGEDLHSVLRAVGTLESYSEHPLSHAVIKYLDAQGINPGDPDSFEVLVGEGIKGKVDKQQWYIGSERLMERMGIEVNQIDKHKGSTLIFAARETELVATFYLRDEVREGMKQIISDLQDQGVQVVMASGDRESAVSAVAKSLGINEFHAQMDPMGKAKLLKELRQQKGHVAMVGDGINDAAALVEASLSFAMGSGTEAAMQAADVTIVKNDLLKISEFLKISRKTHRVILENLFFSFIYNIIGIPLAAGAFVYWGLSIPPAFAGLAMGLSSVSVVLNSLRIKRI